MALAVTGEGALARGLGASAKREKIIQNKKDKQVRKMNLHIGVFEKINFGSIIIKRKGVRELAVWR